MELGIWARGRRVDGHVREEFGDRARGGQVQSEEERVLVWVDW